MLFKRYASPFLFLDILIESERLTEGIDEIYKQRREEQYWELYLATLPLNEKSYEDWRKEMKKGSSDQSNNPVTKKDVETAINQSKSILSNFNPLK